MAELIQLPFRAGVDEGTDSKQLPPGTLLVGKNCRQDKAGRIRKRLGYTALVRTEVGGDDLTAGERIIPYGDSLGVCDGTDAVAYVTSLGKWSRIDSAPVLSSTSRPLVDTTRTVSQTTMAAYGDWLVQVWTTELSTIGSRPINGAPMYVQIEDSSTGQRVLAPTLVADVGLIPRVLVSGTKAYILYVTTGSVLKSCALNLTTFAVGSPETIATGIERYDAQMVGDVAYIVYSDGSLQAERWDLLNATRLHAETPAGAASYEAIAIDATGGTYCLVAYSTAAPTTRILTLDADDMTTIAGPTQVSAAKSYIVAIARVDATYLSVAYTQINSTYYYMTTTSKTYDQTSHASHASAKSQVTHHTAIASNYFTLGGRLYFAASVVVIPPAIATSNNVTVSPHSAVVLEAAALNDYDSSLPHRRAGTLENRTSLLSWVPTQPATDSDGRVHVATVRKQAEPVGTDSVPCGATVHAIEAGGDDWGRPLPLGRSVIWPGSAPTLWDGSVAFPYGFIHEPDIVSASASNAGSMATGTYLYSCVYEWRDANGLLHRSAPSATVTVANVPASGSVALKIATTGVDVKEKGGDTGTSLSLSPVRIAVYRSEVNSSILYRLTYEPSYNVVTNDPLNALVTFTDTKADSSIASSGPVVALATRPQLYTAQELEEVSPGAATTGAVHRGRLWLLGSDRRTLAATKKFEDDPELAPGFNEAFWQLFDRPKYVLVSLDDKLAALGEDSIDVVFGDGPDSEGNNSDWQIARVQTEVGCTNPKSVAVAPPGVVFLSTRPAFELLDRGLTIHNIGQSVEDTLASYPNITSAVTVPEHSEVRWTCNDSAGTSGIVVAWDYSRNAWYTRTPMSGAAWVDAALVNGVYTLLKSDGKVYQETSATCLDDGSYVAMDVQVPVYPTGPGGWHRLKSVQIVGESKSNHGLTISIARNFSSSFEQTKSFEPSTGVSSISTLEQAKVTLQHQKRQAAVIRIQDVAPSNTTAYPVGTGEGPVLEMLALSVQRKSGPAKLPADKKG